MLDAVKLPVIGWIVVDVLLILVLFVDGVAEMMTVETLAPLAIGFGVWAGYKAVEFGGSFGTAIGAGLIVGLACALLTLLLGPIHGMSTDATVPMAVYSMALNVAGAVVGGGFLLTRAPGTA